MLTEIMLFQLRVSGSLLHKDSPNNKVLGDFLTSELAAHGAHNAYYGQLIEKPETAVVFVNWDSLEANKSYMCSPDYEINFNKLRTIISEQKAPTILHVLFIPSDNPSSSLGANPKVGVTEIVFFYFSSTLTDTPKAAFMSSSEQMQPIMERSEALEVYSGWALEDHVPNPGPQPVAGEESKVRMSLVGWVDVEAHMRFQSSQDFKENIHHVLGVTELKYTELFHVKLQAANSAPKG